MHDESLSKFFLLFLIYFHFSTCVFVCDGLFKYPQGPIHPEKKCERHPLLFAHLHLQNLDVGVLAVQNKLPVFKYVYRNL
jgi:hypothetical protein